MAFNLFKAKKYVSLFMLGFLPTMIMLIMFLFSGNILFAGVGWFLGLILGGVLNIQMTKNALSDMMDGAGLLCFTISSRGIMSPFILTPEPPYLVNRKRGIKTLFNRDIIFYLRRPHKGTYKTIKAAVEDGKKDPTSKEFNVSVSKEDESALTFGFQQFPCLLWNEATGSFISKDTLSKMEISNMILHEVQHIRRTTEDLNVLVRDFTRYVVETGLKPKQGIWNNWLFWVGMGLAGLLIVVGLIKVAPQFLSTFSDAAKTIS